MRSYTRIIKLIAVALVLFHGNACTRKFEEINTDPNLVTKEFIRPSMLFTAVLKNSIFDNYGGDLITNYAAYYSAQDQGTIFLNRNWEDPFNGFYKTSLINISEVVRLTSGNLKLINPHSMARIWRVWLFHQLTDIYGDIPYADAVKDVVDVINQPKYDTQEFIYTDMLKELKEAAADLNSDPELSTFGDADILFSGNTDKWKKFANSLRLRLAIRVRYTDPALAQQNISEVINAPLIDENSDNVSLTTIDGADDGNRNPLYNRFLNVSGYPMWVSLTTTENLLRLNDPRLTIFALPAEDGITGYRGRPMSLLNDEKLPYSETTTARLPMFFQDAVYKIIVMNAAEVYFLRAEAALAGLSSEDAGQMYRSGIQASLEQYNADPSVIADYLSSPVVVLSGTDEEKLEQIIVQKWLAIYFESKEAWAEFRRTGYPRIWTGSDKGSTNGEIPRRATYPQNEYAKNEANVKEAAGRYENGDALTSRVWWDKKPGLPFAHPKQGIFPPE